jgi:hypothetical protein
MQYKQLNIGKLAAESANGKTRFADDEVEVPSRKGSVNPDWGMKSGENR